MNYEESIAKFYAIAFNDKWKEIARFESMLKNALPNKVSELEEKLAPIIKNTEEVLISHLPSNVYGKMDTSEVLEKYSEALKKTVNSDLCDSDNEKNIKNLAVIEQAFVLKKLVEWTAKSAQTEQENYDLKHHF